MWIAGLLLVGAGQFALPACEQAEQPVVELFSDDFSRYGAGPLSRPIGNLNGAIQEYHYLSHRGVPLEPWANAICHLDAWSAGKDNGEYYVEQTLPLRGVGMNPALFSPLLVTGDPEWRDYTVETFVQPLSADGSIGLVFRYHTNRHHCLFCLQDGNKARLALRLPLDAQFRVAAWKELGMAEFPYEKFRYYRLRVENEGTKIRAYVDGKLVLTAECDELSSGKVGVSANSPARFKSFRVLVAPGTKATVEQQIANGNSELAALQAANPKPKLWKRFDTPRFGAGRNVRFGDLDSDGTVDMLIAQNVPQTQDDSAVEISCLTAVSLEGRVLWQHGEPDRAHALLTCDTPFQVHDIDGDGRQEVVVAVGRQLQVLDGKTGEIRQAVAVPKVKDYPKVHQSVPQNWPTDINSGDSIAFLNFSGNAGRHEILLKDRYWNFWVLDNDLQLLWTGQGMLGHYPFAFAAPNADRDLLAIGYSLWNGDGKRLRTVDHELRDHADSVAVGNFGDRPDEPPRAYYCGSDEGFILVDHRGIVERHMRIGHAQTAAIGKFRPDLPGLQYLTINFWRSPGIISLFRYDGELLQQEEPIHTGSPLLPVNWCGDGREFILLSGNIREGGMLDGRMRRVVRFPDDGHPDLCAAVLDLTGDPRDEVVLWDQDRVWIYTQDRPFEGNRIYAPVRNPHYNDSNYRCTVSMPGCNGK
ncbi:MAG: hypothetical protein ACT4QC_17925 [Planctomycetaceae bacterium]